jgi:4-hydroxythreonine-4-phosphate dehydrogenase
MILVSSGEPAGIGPDICLMLAREHITARIAVLGDPELLRQRAGQLGFDLRVQERESCAAVSPHRAGELQVLPVPVQAAVRCGKLNPANAGYVIEVLRRAAAACVCGEASALVTAPVQKSIINEAGIPFSGHTEFLAELTGAPLPVMMLASGALRVALVTTHLPLREVADAVTTARVTQTLEIMDHDLRRLFGLERPVIRVLGLNPHAGENGVLGSEDDSIIAPAIEALRARGFQLIGPLPADTAFAPEFRGDCDAFLAMYHDQGLPVIKALAFGEIVNVTLGLPIIRTSVDHGTALSLAGSGRAKGASLRAATDLAIRLARGQARPCIPEHASS